MIHIQRRFHSGYRQQTRGGNNLRPVRPVDGANRKKQIELILAAEIRKNIQIVDNFIVRLAGRTIKVGDGKIPEGETLIGIGIEIRQSPVKAKFLNGLHRNFKDFCLNQDKRSLNVNLFQQRIQTPEIVRSILHNQFVRFGVKCYRGIWGIKGNAARREKLFQHFRSHRRNGNHFLRGFIKCAFIRKRIDTFCNSTGFLFFFLFFRPDLGGNPVDQRISHLEETVFHVVNAIGADQNGTVLDFILETGKFANIFQYFQQRNFLQFKIRNLSGTNRNIRRWNNADSGSFRIILLAERGKACKNRLDVRCLEKNFIYHDLLKLVI